MPGGPHAARAANRCPLHLNEFLIELLERDNHGCTPDPATGDAACDGIRQ